MWVLIKGISLGHEGEEFIHWAYAFMKKQAMEMMLQPGAGWGGIPYISKTDKTGTAVLCEFRLRCSPSLFFIMASRRCRIHTTKKTPPLVRQLSRMNCRLLLRQPELNYVGRISISMDVRLRRRGVVGFNQQVPYHGFTHNQNGCSRSMVILWSAGRRLGYR